MSQQLEQRLRSLEATLLINPRDPWTHTRRGHILLQLGRLEEATAAFTKVVALAPQMPEGPQGLGEVELVQGSWATAQTHLTQALTLEKNHVPTLSTLIRVHEERAERHLAEPYYAAVLSAKPDDPEWTRRAALNLYLQAKFALSLPLLQRAHEKLEQNDEVTAALGCCLAHEESFRAAREYLEPLAARKVLSTDDELTFARVLTRLDDWSAAALVWNRLKAVSALTVEARVGLGRCHEESGRHREAIEELAPVAAATADADAYWLLARAHDGLSNAAEALRSAEQGLARFSTDPRLHVLAGKALLQLGRIADGVTALERAVRYAPDLLPAWLLLADGHCRLEQFDAAARAFERLVAIAPGDATLHFRRATFEREHGTLLRAKDCFTRAFQADKQSSLSAFGAADCAAELGELPEARAWVQKALSIDPGLVAALRLSGLLHLRENHLADALKQLGEASRLLPKDVTILQAIAQCHRKQQDDLHEAEALERAMAVEASAATAKRLGQVSSGLRRYERAIEVLGFAVKETPNDAEAGRDLGLAFEQLGQLEAARTALARSCDVDRSDPHSHFALGRVCSALDDAEAAVTALEHAVRLDATLPGLEMALGQTYHRLGLRREASQVYRRLVNANPKDLVATFELGRVLAENGEATDAAHYLERVVEQQPSHGRAWLILAALRSTSQQFGVARDCFSKATTLLPDSVEAFRGLAESAAAVGEHDEAVRAARQWLRLQPKEVAALSRLAASLEALLQFTEAERVWQQALKQDPTSNEYMLRLGLVTVKLNRFDEAIEYLTRALANGVQAADHWEILADCHERLGNRDQVVFALNTVCELDPHSAPRLRRLGFAELAVGHEPKAIAALERAWQAGATDEECRNCIASLYRNQAEREVLAERPEPGLAALQKAIEYLPNDLQLRIAVGNLLRRLGRLDQAFAAFERAVTIDAYRADCHLQLAELAEAQGELERAIAAYGRVRQLAPDNHVALSGLARTLWRSGKQRDALEVLERVVELSPNEAEPRLQLGGLLLLEKRPKDALAHLEFAADALPLNADAQHQLGVCYAELGRDSAAIPAFERAIAQRPKDLVWTRQLVASLASLGKTAELAEALRSLHGATGWTAADAATLGLALAQIQRDEPAVEMLREAIATEPSDELWLSLLDCLARSNRHQEVVECANAILRDNPAQQRALQLAARATLAIGEDESSAVAYFERILALEPANTEAQREVVRLRSKRAAASTNLPVEEAIAELRRALELSPANCEVLYRLAQCYQRLDQAQAALDHVKRCLAADEQRQSAWILRGELEAAAGRFGEARDSYEKAVTLAPTDRVALAGLARVLESLDELPAAAARYSALCQLEPEVVQWRERIVELLQELDDKPGLVEHFTALATLRQLTGAERRRLGFLEAELGQHESAVTNLTQALSVVPSDPGCLFQLAASLAAVGREPDGIAWLERLVRLDDSYPRALERLGISLSHADRHEQAIANLERARTRQPEDLEVLEALGRSYAATGKPQQQLEAWLALAKLQPSEVAHWVNLGQLYFDLNRDEDAIEPWLRAAELGANAALRDQLFDLLMDHADRSIARADLATARTRVAPAIALAAGDALRLLACARRWHRIGELREATDVAQRSRAIADGLEVNLLLGELWLEQERPLEAGISFERAIHLRVDSTAALVGLGRAQLASKAYADAEATLQRAGHLAPGESRVDELLVQLFEQTERPRQAIEAQKRVVGRRGNDVDALLRLSELQTIVGDHHAAAESLEGAASVETSSDRVLLPTAEAYAKLERWADVLGVAERAAQHHPGAVHWREWRGRALGHLGRVEDAIEELESVKRLRPGDQAVEAQLADLYARSGRAAAAAIDPRQAVEALQKALAHGDNRVATRRQLAENLQTLGDLHGALGWAESCVRDEPSLAHWLLLGGLEAALGRYDRAATAYESAATCDAHHVPAWEGLGLCFERLERVDVALDALQKSVGLRPTALALEGLSRLHGKRADWKSALAAFAQLGHLRPLTSNEQREVAEAHQQLGQFEEAAAAYEEAIELTPANTELLVALGRLRLNAGKPEDGISALEKAQRLEPEHDAIDELLANAYSRAGRHERAIESARRQLARIKSEPMLRIIALAHEALGQHAEAAAVMAEIASLSGGSAESLLALGQAQIKSGEREQAITTLWQSRESSGGRLANVELRPLLLEAAQNRLNLGRAEQCLGMVEQGLAVSTDAPDFQLAFAKLLLSLKFADRALAVLEIAAPKFSGNAEPANLAAAILTEQQRWQEAHGWYERANSIRLDDFQSLVGLGRCRLALGRPGDSRAPLMAALEQRPDDDQLVAWIVQSLEGESASHERRQCLEALVRLRPTDRQTRRRLAALEASAQRHQRVIELLESVEPQAADNADGLLLLAQSYHAMGQDQDTQRVCQAVLRLRPNEPQATRLLGSSQAQSGDVKAAIVALEAAFATGATPEVAGQLCELHRAEAARLEASGDSERAVVAYGRVIALVPQDFQARLTLARLQTRLGRAAQAIETLRVGLQASGEHLEGFVLLGQLYMESGRAELGVEAFRMARRLSPASNSVAAQLGIALSRNGNNDEALELLLPLTSDVEVSARVREELAVVQRRRGNTAAAAAQLEQLRHQQALSVEQQRELALHWADTERQLEAGELLAHLFRADPSDFDVAFAFGQVAQRLNAAHDALEALRAAARLKPDRADVAYRFGEALLRSDQPREAQSALERALSLGHDKAELHEMLAVCAVRQDNRPRWVQALRARAALLPQSAAAQAEFAEALAATGSYGEAQVAYKRALELERNPIWSRALARCCEALSDWTGRLEALNAVCELLPGDGSAWAEYGLARYAAGHVHAALDALGQALRLDPTIEAAKLPYVTIARALAQESLKKQEPAAALELYQNIARFQQPTSDLLLEHASCHSRLGQLAQASDLLQMALTLTPGNEAASLLLGSLLVRQSRQADAIRVYEAAMQQQPTPFVARALSMQYDELGQFELSARALERGFVPASADADYVLAYMTALTSTGRAGDAINVGRGGLERYPQSAELLQRVGALCAGQGWHVQSVELLGRAINIDATQPSRYYLLVRELLELGRDADASQWLEAGLQRFPTDASLVNSLVPFGMRADNAKDYRRSAQIYQRVLASDARNLAALQGLGNACVMLGQNAQALELYERAVALMPNDAQLRFNLGSLYAMQRRLADATRHWEVLRRLNPELGVRLAQILGS